MKRTFIFTLTIFFATLIMAQSSDELIPVVKNFSSNPCEDEGKSDKWGYINSQGTLIVPFKYDYCGKFSNGLGQVGKNDLLGFINKKGKIVIGCNYDRAGNFSDGLAWVKIGNREEFINTAGQTVFRVDKSKISAVGWSFSQGLCAAKSAKNSKWGFINRSGNFAIPPQFEDVGSFSENLCAVKLDGKWGFIDKLGKVVIDYQFDYGYIPRGFHEGLAAIEQGDYWGFIDKYGNIVISPAYSEVEDFSEGLCVVGMGLRYIYINKNDENVFPSKSLTKAESFKNGVALVINDDNVAQLIDKNGNILKSIAKNVLEVWVGTYSKRLSSYPCDVYKNIYINHEGKIIYESNAIACFPENAKIPLQNGDLLPISQIKSGMQILSYNPKTLKTEYSTVKKLLVHDKQKYKLTRLTFLNSAALYASITNKLHILQIESTANHPILTTKGYKALGDITKDDKILYYNELNRKIIECSVLQVEKNYRSVDKVYNIKLENGNSYIVDNLVASPKCPFVYAKGNNDYIFVEEILKSQISDKLDRYDYVNIPFDMLKNNKLTIKISEEKDEISYIDHIYLQAGNKIIQANIKNANILKQITKNDNTYFTLHKGESLEMVFDLPKNIDKTTEIKLVAKGYYELANYLVE